ncbi:DUF983 domain-containing protein [Planktotalea sp.]|uniref:DUF983 domain-containing protein n=1 Tax=Planktotalea sp. TaxID=2029877 RepID=UPI003D6B5F0A
MSVTYTDSPNAASNSALEAEQSPERALKPALLRGWRRKCPNCGEGPLLQGYLKMRKSCTVCKQDFTAARADDGPAYLTILIVGHLMAPGLHIAFVHYRPEPLVLFSIFAVGCVALSLYLLPRLKGAIVAFQWSRQMFGFANEEVKAPLEAPESP